MKTELLKKALEKVGSAQVLVNLVSLREKELIEGAKPLIRPDSLDVDKCDIALQEIAEGKIIAEVDFDAINRAEVNRTKWSKKITSVDTLYAE